MYDDEMFNIFLGFVRITLLMVFVLLIISFTASDKGSYTDYEITDCRYFIKVSSWSRTYEKMDVFYENTKVTISVSSIEIDELSFVRVYDDALGIVEVHMTKDDYMFYTNSNLEKEDFNK